MKADKIFLGNLIFASTPQRFWLKNCGYSTYLNARDRLPDTLILAYFSSKYQRFWLIFIENFTYFDTPDPCRTYSCLLFKKVSAFLIDFSWRQDCQYGINKFSWAWVLLVLWCMWPLWLPNRGGVIVYDAIHRINMEAVCFASKDSYIPINN